LQSYGLLAKGYAMLEGKKRNEFLDLYLDPNISVAYIAEHYKQATGTIYRWGFECKVKRPTRLSDTTLKEQKVIDACLAASKQLPVYPRITIGAIRPYMDTQATLVLKVSDLHWGRKTVTYSAEVANVRLQRLTERVLDITKVFRRSFTINHLVIFWEGDMVTGEGLGGNILLEELEKTVMTQVFKEAIPNLTQQVLRLHEHFATITIYGVKGNHGKLFRYQVSRANWDTVVYEGVKARIPQVDVHIATDWFIEAEVEGVRFFITHGDGVKGAGNPTAIASMVQQWKKLYKFDWCSMAHFHSLYVLPNCIVNGTPMTDDEWSKRRLGKDGDCEQTLLLLAGGQIRHIIPIWLDERRT